MAAMTKKLVIVGDGYCGKTSLLVVFNTGRYEDDYSPTVFESYWMQIMLGECLVDLSIWDTAGQEEYDALRVMCYSDADVVLISFAIDCPDSLKNVQHKWLPEVRHYCQGAPIVLVGTKKDLRDDPGTIRRLATNKQRPVLHKTALSMSSRIKAYAYLECSAKTNDGVREVFITATQAAISGRNNKTIDKICCIF